MNLEQFIEHMRQEIREEGFISMLNLAGRIVLRMNEHELVEKINAKIILDKIDDCHDIHKTDFMTSKSNSSRVLYYYNPNKNKC
jgi:hypothetical protein